MRILHVITSLLTGGAEHLMVDLLPWLRDRGYEVDLCVFYGKRTAFYAQLESAGIKIHTLSDKPDFYNVGHIGRLRTLMKRFDVVHTHNTAPQLFAAVGKPKGVRLVTTEHNTSNRRRHISWLKFADKWMYVQYDHIVCISDAAENNLRAYLGRENDDSISTVYNGVNVGHFVNAQVCTEILQRYSGLHLAAMVAAFRPQKDQDTLIKAYKYLPDDFHLLLVGDGERREELQTIVSELSLDDRIHFLGLRRDIPDILKTVEVVIMSSHYEGLSLSSIEGMASGHPFVASDVDGLREVTQGYGLLFPHGDDKALAEIIRQLCEHPDYAKKIATRCQQRAMQYDISRMVEGYCAVYESIFSNH